MVERGKLEELLGKIEAATGPDHDLDAAIAAVFAVQPVQAAPLTGNVMGLVDGNNEWIAILRVTASIDAALALVERVKPDANCSGFDRTPLGIDAYISRNNVTTGHWLSEGHHKTSIPLAVIAALLRALLAEAGTPT